MSSEEKEKAVLAYRSTPLACGYSPGELLMGRRIRTTVPVIRTLLTPKWPNFEQVREQEAQHKVQQESYFNARHHAAPLRKRAPGTEVCITTHPEPGVIIKEDAHSPQKYQVQTPTGSIKRKRVQLLPLPDEESRE